MEDEETADANEDEDAKEEIEAEATPSRGEKEDEMKDGAIIFEGEDTQGA